jgi:uncharacterized membrane protein (DUF4010 family)
VEQTFALTVLEEFGTALLIGALVGVEREKRKAEEGHVGIGGLRTFILFALIGAIAGWLTRALDMPWLLVAALTSVAAPVIAGYVLVARVHRESLGLTTEAAAIAVCLLGAMATLGHRELAVGLAVVTAAVLAYKHPLHGLVEKIGWDDVFAALRLLIATFIVLPLLPDRPVDPWEALNPYSLWLLVLLISGLSLVGYVATRWLGPGKGTALTGLTGGLVSSTAVTLTFARRSRDEREGAVAVALAAGILLAWGVMFLRVVVEVLVVNPSLVARVLVPFTAMAAAAALLAWTHLGWDRTGKGETAQGAQEVPLKNPFSLTEAAKFAALFALVLLVVKLVQTHAPGNGVYVVAALAGLTDVDAITLSMASYARTGDPAVAVTAIVIAAITNTLVKAGLVVALGGSGLRGPVLRATALVAAVGVGALAVPVGPV